MARTSAKEHGNNHFLWCLFVSFVAITLVLATFFPASPSSTRLTEQEKRGKQIYLKTISPSGREIKAFVGKGSIEAPGSVLTCVNCHDFDGHGLDEVGITATNITWEDLTRPYGIKRIKGREHPPYTEETLARAITQGVDPAGSKLHDSMPRYQMSKADLDDLIAYLKVIATALDPGLSETTIKVGTILPTKGRFATMGREMHAVMEAYFKEINRWGGIYNRKIELHTVEYAGTLDSTVAAFKTLIHEEEVFAIVSAFTAGADTEVAALVESEEVPLIGPFTLFPEDIYALNRFTFYLFSGLREQARAQVVYAKEKLPGPDPPIAIIYPENEIPTDIVKAIEDQITRYKWQSIGRHPYSRNDFQASQLAVKLSQNKTEALFFLGAWEELRTLIRRAEKLKWTPYIFMSAAQVRRDVFDAPLGFSKKIFLAFPTLPSDQTADGVRELNTLFKKYNLSRKHMTAQISAYCSAKILVEGIKLAGGRPSREKLITKLEKLYKFDTGLTPRITYDPNRRIGALGAYMVTIDLEKKNFVPVSKWITLE